MRGGLLGEWLHMQPMTAEQADFCLICCLVALTGGWVVHWIRTKWDGPRPDCRRCEWPVRCKTAEDEIDEILIRRAECNWRERYEQAEEKARIANETLMSSCAECPWKNEESPHEHS